MNKATKLIVLGVAVLLAGCSTKRIAELDTYPGLQLAKNEKWGYEYIERVTYNYPGASKTGKDALPVCIAQNIQNKAVTLRGNQNSAFIGGAFWNTSTSDTVGGGSVINYVSDDRSTVIADGTTFIDIGNILAPNKDAVTFRLTAKRAPTGTSLVFSNLERATTESGNMANPGFNKIGVWSGARPLPVLGSLKKTADTINNCLGTL